eukprot:g9345.t1
MTDRVSLSMGRDRAPLLPHGSNHHPNKRHSKDLEWSVAQIVYVCIAGILFFGLFFLYGRSRNGAIFTDEKAEFNPRPANHEMTYTIAILALLLLFPRRSRGGANDLGREARQVQEPEPIKEDRGAAPSPTLQKEPRLHYLDNLKSFLIFLVVTGHTAIMFGLRGNDEAWHLFNFKDNNFGWIGTTFIACGAMVVIPSFFFIAGLMTPSSLEKQGVYQFTRKRLQRYGLPLLLTFFLLWPLHQSFVYKAVVFPRLHDKHKLDPKTGEEVGFSVFDSLTTDTHFAWFLQLLTVLCLGFALVFPRGLADVPTMREVPSYARILLYSLAVSVLSAWICYATSRRSKDQTTLWNVSVIPGNGILGMFFFLAGAIAKKNHWLVRENTLIVAVYVCSAVAVTLISAAAILAGRPPFHFPPGNKSTETTPLLAALCGIGSLPTMTLVIFFFRIFAHTCNKTNAFLTFLSDSSFGVYFLHQFVLDVVAYGWMSLVELTCRMERERMLALPEAANLKEGPRGGLLLPADAASVFMTGRSCLWHLMGLGDHGLYYNHEVHAQDQTVVMPEMVPGFKFAERGLQGVGVKDGAHGQADPEWGYGALISATQLNSGGITLGYVYVLVFVHLILPRPSAALAPPSTLPWRIRNHDSLVGDSCLTPRNRLDNETALAWPVCCLDRNVLVRVYGREQIREACFGLYAACCDRYRWREELVQKALNCEHGLVPDSAERRFWRLWKRQVLFATPTSKSVASKVLKHPQRKHCVLGEFAAAVTSASVLQMGLHRFREKTSPEVLEVYFGDMRFQVGLTQVLFAAVWGSKSLTLYDLLLGGQWSFFAVIDGLAHSYNEVVLEERQLAAFSWGPDGSVRDTAPLLAERLAETHEDEINPLKAPVVVDQVDKRRGGRSPREAAAVVDEEPEEAALDVPTRGSFAGPLADTDMIAKMGGFEDDGRGEQEVVDSKTSTRTSGNNDGSGQLRAGAGPAARNYARSRRRMLCPSCKIAQWESDSERLRDKAVTESIMRSLRRNERISVQLLLDNVAPASCPLEGHHDQEDGIGGAGRASHPETQRQTSWRELLTRDADAARIGMIDANATATRWIWLPQPAHVGDLPSTRRIRKYFPAPERHKVNCLRQATLHLAMAHGVLAHDVPTIYPLNAELGHRVHSDARAAVAKAQRYLERAFTGAENPFAELVLFGSPHDAKPHPNFALLPLLSSLSLAASALFFSARGLSRIYTVPFYDSVANNVRVSGGVRPFCTDGVFIKMVDALPITLQGLFVEVGGHQGDCVIHALKKFANARAIVFEPNKLALEAFKRTVLANGWEQRAKIEKAIITGPPPRQDADKHPAHHPSASTRGTGTSSSGAIGLASRIPQADKLHTVFLNQFSSAESFVTKDSFFGTRKKGQIHDATACLLRPEAKECENYDVVKSVTLDEIGISIGISIKISIGIAIGIGIGIAIGMGILHWNWC